MFFLSQSHKWTLPIHNMPWSDRPNVKWCHPCADTHISIMPSAWSRSVKIKQPLSAVTTHTTRQRHGTWFYPFFMVCHGQSNTPLSAVLLRHNLHRDFFLSISIKCKLTLLNLGSQTGWERDNLTSSANQLGCTDVPGMSVTWSKPSVPSVFHV